MKFAVVKSHVIATLLVAAVHITLPFIWAPYLRLLTSCGAMASNGNDIADIPRQWFLGSLIIGLLWIVMANTVVATVKKHK